MLTSVGQFILKSLLYCLVKAHIPPGGLILLPLPSPPLRNHEVSGCDVLEQEDKNPRMSFL